MANLPQAKKRARQAEGRRQLNVSHRSNMRTHIKRILKAVLAGDKTAAADAFKAAVPFIDRMVNKKLVHRNKAARLKSRLNAKVKDLAA